MLLTELWEQLFTNKLKKDGNLWLFTQKKLSPTQQRYSAYNRELLASYMAMQKEDKCSPRPLRHLDFISQFTTDIRYLKGLDNVVADALSRIHIATISRPSAIDYYQLAKEQENDAELQNILSGNATTSLVLRPLPIGQPPVILHCYISSGRIRPFVPQSFRRAVFSNLHSFSHRVKASVKLIDERYVWASVKADVASWARECLQCQKSKVTCHTKSKIGVFVPPSARFEHMQIDLIGPLPPYEGF
ncbi:uncharacterized protein LOC118198593 [Stegodyphus dumicola]|uniref:uncharacterized protein LOC118198593 n=1 Tax=Stegodyphus dumicola TaxID=202533 RepID=UPI0015A7B3DB|nr:uncharacterized protein LOC118198593 [Stegodyphus dumicola]XP_035226207.1 uncharacterized protein LOC118198593 [Stegodyphus dumicola]XP_035226208.1 uncharacterized protein LOC118198593 [Stegodyphus dumicola]